MVPIWKNIPLLRVLLPLSTGILTGWYLSLHWQIAVVAAIIALPFFLYLQFSGERSRFYNRWLDGLSFNIIFISLGISLVWLQLKPHQPNWTGHFYKEGDVVQLRLFEPYKLLVFDSSNPQWKLKYWKTDCEKLNIHYFCTSEQGAFVMNL